MVSEIKTYAVFVIVRHRGSVDYNRPEIIGNVIGNGINKSVSVGADNNVFH